MIYKGACINVKFYCNNGHYKYYKGTIDRVSKITKNRILCDVMFEDGEYIKNMELFWHDFMNRKSQDTWEINRECSVMQSLIRFHHFLLVGLLLITWYWQNDLHNLVKNLLDRVLLPK